MQLDRKDPESPSNPRLTSSGAVLEPAALSAVSHLRSSEERLDAVPKLSPWSAAPQPAWEKAGTPARSLDEIQMRVDRYIGQFKDGYWHPLSNLARLTEEVGELARELNHRHGQKPKRTDEGEKNLALELGDVLFVLTTLSNSLGLRLEDCFEAVLHKYQLRDHNRYERRAPEGDAPSS